MHVERIEHAEFHLIKESGLNETKINHKIRNHDPFGISMLMIYVIGIACAKLNESKAMTEKAVTETAVRTKRDMRLVKSKAATGIEISERKTTKTATKELSTSTLTKKSPRKPIVIPQNDPKDANVCIKGVEVIENLESIMKDHQRINEDHEIMTKEVVYPGIESEDNQEPATKSAWGQFNVSEVKIYNDVVKGRIDESDEVNIKLDDEIGNNGLLLESNGIEGDHVVELNESKMVIEDAGNKEFTSNEIEIELEDLESEFDEIINNFLKEYEVISKNVSDEKYIIREPSNQVRSVSINRESRDVMHEGEMQHSEMINESSKFRKNDSMERETEKGIKTKEQEFDGNNNLPKENLNEIIEEIEKDHGDKDTLQVNDECPTGVRDKEKQLHEEMLWVTKQKVNDSSMQGEDRVEVQEVNLSKKFPVSSRGIMRRGLLHEE